jgi:large-conductance mechanosensitive channel
MILFWAESAIIGFFNILKMQKIGGAKSEMSVVFFLFHYGMFMSGHLTFINGFFGEQSVFGWFSGGDAFPRGGGYAATDDTMLISSIVTIFPAFLSLLISHGISYYENFIGKKEYLDPKNNIGKQMMQPYGRIIIMHITLLFGGFLIAIFRFKAVALVLLIILKIIADLKAHKKQHRTAVVMQDAQAVNN